MLSSNSDSIFNLCKPAFYITKVFGFFPFSIDFSKRYVTVKILDVLQILLFIAAYAFAFINRYATCIAIEPFSLDKTLTFAEVSGSAGNFAGFVILMISAVGNFFNRKKLLRILKNLELIDQKVCSVCISFN